MSDLDRLLELKEELNEETGYFNHEKYYVPLEKEFDTLKAKIEGKIENQITYEKTDFKCDICGKLHGIYQPITKLESQVAKLKEELEVWKNNFDNAFEVMQGFKSTLDEIKSLGEGKHELANWQVSLRHLMSILAKHEGKK